MPTKAFITGIAGFAGSYLAESLIESGEQVEGTCLPDEPLANIKAIGKKITLHRCDICDAPGLGKEPESFCDQRVGFGKNRYAKRIRLGQALKECMRRLPVVGKPHERVEMPSPCVHFFFQGLHVSSFFKR